MFPFFVFFSCKLFIIYIAALVFEANILVLQHMSPPVHFLNKNLFTDKYSRIIIKNMSY